MADLQYFLQKLYITCSATLAFGRKGSCLSCDVRTIHSSRNFNPLSLAGCCVAHRVAQLPALHQLGIGQLPVVDLLAIE
jgi:hypothetical protein